MQYDATMLWDLMKRQGRSISWLARETGYNRTYLHMMRAGMKPITQSFVQKASAALELDPNSLFMASELTEVMTLHDEGKVA